MTDTAKWLIGLVSIVIIILVVIVLNQANWIKYYEDYVVQLQSGKAALAIQVEELESEKSTLVAEIEELQSEKSVLIGRVEDLEEKLRGTLPYYGARYNELKLNNKDGTYNPTWEELKAFLLRDNTDEDLYMETYKVCGDFAEALHNNAESVGIRAAFVVVDFQDEPISHALNAFYTVDKGLVYIDCTGERLRAVTFESWLYEQTCPCEYDTVAYMQIGSQLGLVSIDKVVSLQYASYIKAIHHWEEYQFAMEEYNREIEQYNEDVDQYNLEVSSHIYYEDSPELAKIEQWERNLNEWNVRLVRQLQEIGRLGEPLPCCWFEPLGIVENIEIYW